MDIGAQLRVDGVVVFWSLGEWTDLDRLRDGLMILDREKFVPEERSPAAALKDALRATFPKALIEPLKKKDQYEVRDIIRGDELNDYRLRCTVTFRPDTYSITMYPFDREVADKLTDEFNRYMGLVRAAQVTACLTSILSDLQGISLRGRGSVYWLPGNAIPEWQDVCDAVESSSVTGSSNRCYLIRHAMDADALRAVQDAIVQEVMAECARIEAEIASGELGERALTHRKEEAVAMRDKVLLFEGILGRGLDGLRGKVDELETSAAQAALMASLAGDVA